MIEYTIPAAGLAPDGDLPPAPTEVADAGAGMFLFFVIVYFKVCEIGSCRKFQRYCVKVRPGFKASLFVFYFPCE